MPASRATNEHPVLRWLMKSLSKLQFFSKLGAVFWSLIILTQQSVYFYQVASVMLHYYSSSMQHSLCSVHGQYFSLSIVPVACSNLKMFRRPDIGTFSYWLNFWLPFMSFLILITPGPKLIG